MTETVVSLTTHAGRAPFVAPSVLSLARQAEAVSAKLCLAVDEFAASLLPESVKRLIDEGRIELLVEERDFGVNMKWAPARKKHPFARIVALDDDRIYADSALPGLLAASDKMPDAFLCYAYRSLAILSDGHTAPYCLKRRFGPKAVLHTGLEYDEPKHLESGTFIAEHWLGCLHPPEFGLLEIDEAYKRAPKDDDTFLSVLAARKNVPVYCVPCKEPPCVRELDEASFKETALGNQRHDQWSRTRDVLASYEDELFKARIGWGRFGLRLLVTCPQYEKRREMALRECERVGLNVEAHQCHHLKTWGLTYRTCPEDNIREALGKVELGTAATLLAHRSAMKRFLASTHETMLVVEDDVRFLKDLLKLGSYVKSLPKDFDEARFCWGGARGDAKSGESFAGGMWRKVRKNLDSLYMTAAYAVSRKGAENWLKSFDESLDDPLASDLLVRKYGASENVYICNPPCAITVCAGEKSAVQQDNTPLVLDVEACGGKAGDYEGGAA